TSLGDWTPDPARFPEGLAPIAAACAAHGLDFGLWVEPEMASPDSDLLRAHPEWILGAPTPPGHAPTQRRQLVLDFSRADVRDHVVATLDALLASAPIAYLKWDHNRELFPVRGVAGPGAGAQTRGVYEVIDRLRAKWPALEIETCASGGARADLGMLSRTQRVWASDDVDALERARIQRDLSLFVPPDLIGAHVGASPDHTSGRRLPMLTRARVALFFHMGVEADPARLDEAERAELAAAIATYKSLRGDLHAGAFRVLDTEPGVIAWQTLAPDGARGAALAVHLDHAAAAVSAPLRLAGLDPDAVYRLRLPEPWPRPAHRRLAHAPQWRTGVSAPGRVWMEQGVPAPLVHPGAAWLIEIARV
ncbi:MAG: alpha-galactosidase, partial [Alphaproteobacteria bacterium]|nr:alpha-galactosidase [Alphaproteobacteria bacterium]